MSQQGFPNGGILPNDTETHKYSNLILNESEIKEVADAMSNEAFAISNLDTRAQITVATQVEGIVTAALTLAQYYHQQRTYQGIDGYGTQNNPVLPQFSESTRQLFLQSLGANPDPASLFENYNNGYTGPRNLAGVQNVFFNLGSEKDSFSWDANGNLSISDKYKFTGLNDFGVSPPEFEKYGGDIGQQVKSFLTWGVPAVIGVIVGIAIFKPIAEIKTDNSSPKGIILNAIWNSFKKGDPTEPFDYNVYRDENGNPFVGPGGLEPMFIKHTWTPEEIYEWNPALFFAAVAQGLIPFSTLLAMPNFICNSIEVGAGPDPFGFLPNFGQVNADIGTNPNNWSFGGGGNYPRPFTSFAQRIIEASLALGPFAMLDYKNPTTNVSTRISGRIVNLGVVCNGAPGVTGFIRQDWYGADTGGTGYGSNLLKWQWWEQAIKTKHIFPYGHLPGHPNVTIEVATASYAVGNAANFTPDLPVPEDFTLLLGVVLAAAALGAIL